MIRTISTRSIALLALFAITGSTVAGCSSDDKKSAVEPEATTLQQIGEGEGAVNILARPGGAEAGATDPNIDWVSDFEEETGCEADIKEVATSKELVELVDAGGWDVVEAPDDVTAKLIADPAVAPINTTLVPNYDDVFPYLKNQAWNSVDGQMYGIPAGSTSGPGSPSQTWMVTSEGEHPSCSYEWLDWIISPDVDAQVAEHLREAPANERACDLTTDPSFCATVGATSSTG